MPERTSIPLFEWTRDYAVGVAQIDQEHRRLFAFAENIHQAMLAGKGKATLLSLLGALVDYTSYHFFHEHQWMERSGYPELREHVQQHEDLKAQVLAMRDRAAAGEATMTIEVAQFLIEWLKEHTRRLRPLPGSRRSSLATGGSLHI